MGTTSTTNVPSAGGPLDVTLTCDGIASFRLYECTQQNGTWVVSTVIDDSGHAATNAPAHYNCAPPPSGRDVLLYAQILITSIDVPNDVSLDLAVGRGAAIYTSVHVPAHVVSTAVPAEIRLQLHGT